MRRSAAGCFSLICAVAFAWMPVSPAAAAGGGGDIVFAVAGTLPRFPCPEGCDVSFGGPGSGTGHVASTIDGNAVEGTYTVKDGWATGSARYLEADCASGGTADGTVTLWGATTGVIVNTGGIPHRGSINWVLIDVVFRYERVGATAALVVLGGRVTVGYSFTTYSGTVAQPLLPSAGTGAFVVNPNELANNCSAQSGSMVFWVFGDVALLTA